jgi:quercetin dioxygenase-like cupin family protein
MNIKQMDIPIKIETLHEGLSFKVLLISGEARAKMPVHYATCEAFLFVKKGRVVISLGNTDHELRSGQKFVIPARLGHGFRAINSCQALVVLRSDARIEYVNKR